MQTTGHILVTQELGVCMCKLPPEIRPARKYYGIDNQHTAAILIKLQDKILYLPLDIEEVKVLEEGLQKIKQQPLHEPRLVLAATEMPTQANPLNN